MSVDPTEIVGFLTLGIHDAGMYFPEHARVQQTAHVLAARFGKDLGDAPDASMFIGVVEGRLVYAGKLLLGPTLIAKRLIDAAKRFKCGGFRFKRGVAAQEVIAFFAVCAGTRAPFENLDEARRLLQSRGVLGIDLSPQFGDEGWLGGERVSIEEAVAAEVVRSFGGAIPAYQRLREAVEVAHASGERSREVDVPESRATVEALLGALQDRSAEVLHFARYPDYASYTVGHSVRVALLALIVGRQLGLDSRLLVEIGTAGLLHDVGKSKIPHEVLFKPGRLDDEERRVISTHTTLGAKILLATADAPPLGIAAAFGHHLRHDRRGYPRLAPWGASGRVTSLVQVCDVFEALTAVRPYKPSLTPLRAYEIMAGDKGAFDPASLAAFVRAVGFFPPGSRVRLRSGEQAFVLRVGADPMKPVVELTHDAGGAALANADRLVVDLDGEAPGAPREVDDVIMDDVERPAVSAEEVTASTSGDAHDHEHGEKSAEGAPKPAAPTCCHAAGKPAAAAAPSAG